MTPLHRTLASLWLAACGQAFAANLVAGPMVGATDMHGSTIWLQADAPARVEIEFWPLEDREAPRVRTVSTLDAANDHAAQVRLDNLLAGTRYAYRLRLDGQPAGQIQYFRTQTRWQWKTNVEPPSFTALMGSCNYVNEAARDRDGPPFGADFGIFAAMAEKKPDLMLWLGDNSYLREDEWTSAEGMRYRWRADRSQPELQPLLRTGQHAAIWDDHDYGPDDSNSAFELKQVSLDLFKRYWANASYGLPGVPGVFGSFSYSDVDFFLTDNRWYRDADKDQARKDKRMFGEQQMRWLKNAILMSTAPLKVIVGGSQFLTPVSIRTEGWSHFPAERQEFFDWLTTNKVDGVMFLSGDRHFTELTKLDRPGSYPLHDLTCSPLTAGAFNGGADSTRPDRVPGTMVPQRNFCSFTVDGPKQQRTITLKAYDTKGQELWARKLEAQALRTPR